MCVNEAKVAEAIKIRDESQEIMTTCNQGIGYFGGWTGKISSCIGCLEQMISQTNAIGAQCEQIIINGSPIDKGSRHYPNGGAYAQAANLSSAKATLEDIQSKINDKVEDLKQTHKEAKAKYDAAVLTIANTIVPCRRCNECIAQGLNNVNTGCSSTRTTTTSSSTTTRTTSTSGCTSTRTSSSNSTSTARRGTTYNRAVMVALE